MLGYDLDEFYKVMNLLCSLFVVATNDYMSYFFSWLTFYSFHFRQ